MKEFITAVEDVIDEASRPARVKALMEQHNISREEAEERDDKEHGAVPFKIDGRTLRAYPPTEGQMTFLLAVTGRGQTKEQRFAGIVNVLLNSLEGDDADYFEGRLLTRDPKQRLSMETVEGVFEHITEEWFGHPTDGSSGSTGSHP